MLRIINAVALLEFFFFLLIFMYDSFENIPLPNYA